MPTSNRGTNSPTTWLLLLQLCLTIVTLGCAKSDAPDATGATDASRDNADLPNPGEPDAFGTTEDSAPSDSENGGDSGLTGDDGTMDTTIVDAGAPSVPTVCDITAMLKPLYPDAGDAAMPAKHRFSLAIDWAAKRAKTGSGGTAQEVGLVEDHGTWTTQGTLGLSMSLSRTDYLARPFVSYKEIKIRPTPDGCEGEASGDYLWNATDMLFTIVFTAKFTGVTDKDAPAFAVFPATTANLHPFDLYGVAASELLPTGTTSRWVAATGIGVDMPALPLDGTVGVSGFSFANRALSFGTAYRLEILPAAMDLAGNTASNLASISTLADPGMFAQDGFEGELKAFVGGRVKIVDNTSLPIPAGTKALRFAPMSGAANVDWSCEDRFTARLAVPAGATAVKCSYLQYSPKTSTLGSLWTFVRVGVPNGASVEYRFAADRSTLLPSPWTGTLPGSTDFVYGELQQLTLPLPAGTGSEVLFDVDRPCVPTFGPVNSGLIIDDLRVE